SATSAGNSAAASPSRVISLSIPIPFTTGRLDLNFRAADPVLDAREVHRHLDVPAGHVGCHALDELVPALVEYRPRTVHRLQDQQLVFEGCRIERLVLARVNGPRHAASVTASGTSAGGGVIWSKPVMSRSRIRKSRKAST